MLAPVMYEDEGEECWHQLCMKRKVKKVGTSYEEEGEECWHQL